MAQHPPARSPAGDDIPREIAEKERELQDELEGALRGGSPTSELLPRMPFLEAVRQLGQEVGKENILFVHTTLVPIMGAVGEQKAASRQRPERGR